MLGACGVEVALEYLVVIAVGKGGINALLKGNDGHRALCGEGQEREKTREQQNHWPFHYAYNT